MDAAPTAKPPGTAILAGWRRETLPVAVFLICLAWRSPGLFTAPRFWAEEGSHYYAKLQNMAPLKGLVHVVNGNYQFLTNLFVELALRVPARYAAHVTTYLSLAVALACCCLIARLLLSRGCSTLSAAAGCALFALQPGGYEVFLSATNVQWVASVLALMLALSAEVPAASGRAILRYAALLVCGLTGTPSCILLPLVVAFAVWRRTRFGWAMVAVLGLATAIQGFVVIAHRSDLHRGFSLSSHILLPEVFQVFFAQFLPAHVLDALGRTVAPYDTLGHVAGLELVLVGLIGMAGIALVASRRLGVSAAGLLLAGAVAVPLINEFGALSGADDMLSGWGGSRYFFLGASCVTILVAACLDTVTVPGRLFGAVLVILAVLNGITTAAFAQWTRVFLTGPSLAEEVDACSVDHRCIVSVWPAGGPFKVEIGTVR